jgi:hypothetical protein
MHKQSPASGQVPPKLLPPDDESVSMCVNGYAHGKRAVRSRSKAAGLGGDGIWELMRRCDDHFSSMSSEIRSTPARGLSVAMIRRLSTSVETHAKLSCDIPLLASDESLSIWGSSLPPLTTAWHWTYTRLCHRTFGHLQTTHRQHLSAAFPIVRTRVSALASLGRIAAVVISQPRIHDHLYSRPRSNLPFRRIRPPTSLSSPFTP